MIFLSFFSKPAAFRCAIDPDYETKEIQQTNAFCCDGILANIQRIKKLFFCLKHTSPVQDIYTSDIFCKILLKDHIGQDSKGQKNTRLTLLTAFTCEYHTLFKLQSNQFIL